MSHSQIGACWRLREQQPKNERKTNKAQGFNELNCHGNVICCGASLKALDCVE
jgi:hypothetical protein